MTKKRHDSLRYCEMYPASDDPEEQREVYARDEVEQLKIAPLRELAAYEGIDAKKRDDILAQMSEKGLFLFGGEGK